MTCPGAPPWRPTRVILSNDSDKAAEAILLRCEDDSNMECDSWSNSKRSQGAKNNRRYFLSTWRKSGSGLSACHTRSRLKLMLIP